MLAQERKRLPLLDEYVLRLSNAGVSRLSEIASTLGLDLSLVETTAADQMSFGTVLYNRSTAGGWISLTDLGKRVAVELAAVEPVQQQLRVTFDRMTWQLVDYPRRALIKKSTAERQKMFLLPAARNIRIGPDDADPRSLSRLINAGAYAKKKIEVLAVRSIRPSSYVYLPVKLLVYADSARGEVQLGVVVEDGLSREHGLVLQGLGGAEKLGIRVEEAEPRPLLDDQLERMRISREQVASILEVTGASTGGTGTGEEAEVALRKFQVRSISVFEHPRLMREALESSSRRLLLIAPWVQGAVVDDEFLAKLERRLARGVRVHMAYGIGKNDRQSDAKALAELRALAHRFPDRFTFARLANSHAKILIYDSTWITTSFNWLSFRGDPSRTYRMEEGTLVRISDIVDRQYDYYVGEIERQSITAP